MGSGLEGALTSPNKEEPSTLEEVKREGLLNELDFVILWNEEIKRGHHLPRTQRQEKTFRKLAKAHVPGTKQEAMDEAVTLLRQHFDGSIYARILGDAGTSRYSPQIALVVVLVQIALTICCVFLAFDHFTEEAEINISCADGLNIKEVIVPSCPSEGQSFSPFSMSSNELKVKNVVSGILLEIFLILWALPDAVNGFYCYQLGNALKKHGAMQEATSRPDHHIQRQISSFELNCVKHSDVGRADFANKLETFGILLVVFAVVFITCSGLCAVMTVFAGGSTFELIMNGLVFITVCDLDEKFEYLGSHFHFHRYIMTASLKKLKPSHEA